MEERGIQKKRVADGNVFESYRLKTEKPNLDKWLKDQYYNSGVYLWGEKPLTPSTLNLTD